MNITNDLCSIIKKMAQETQLSSKEAYLYAYVTGLEYSFAKKNKKNIKTSNVKTTNSESEKTETKNTPVANNNPLSIFEDEDTNYNPPKPNKNNKKDNTDVVNEQPSHMKSAIDEGSKKISDSLDSLFVDDDGDMPIEPPSLVKNDITESNQSNAIANPTQNNEIAKQSPIASTLDSLFD